MGCVASSESGGCTNAFITVLRVKILDRGPGPDEVFERLPSGMRDGCAVYIYMLGNVESMYRANDKAKSKSIPLFEL